MDVDREEGAETGTFVTVLAQALSSEAGMEALELSYHSSSSSDQAALSPLPLFRALALSRGLCRLDLGTAGQEPWLGVGDVREVSA